MLFAFFPPLNFVFFAHNSRVRGLAAKSAPDQSLARNRVGAGWDRACGLDGCQQQCSRSREVPWSLRPRAAWKWLARASRLLGRGGRKSSGSAAGKPYASAQTGRGELKPEFFMFSARARGSFAACFFSASKLFETLRKFTRFAAAGPCRSRFACQISRAYSSSFFPASANFYFFLHVDFDTDKPPAQNSSDVRAGCTLWTAVCRRTMYDLKVFELAS